MPFTIHVRADGTPVRWETDGEGARAVPDPDYEPALYAAARNDRTRYLDWLADELAADPKVTSLTRERWYRSLDADERSPVCRIGLERLDEVRQVAREVRQREQDAHAPGVVPLYDVDLDPGFRYCLDTGRDPVAGSQGDRPLRALSLSLPTAALAAEDLSALRIEGDPCGASATGADASDDAAAVDDGAAGPAGDDAATAGVADAGPFADEAAAVAAVRRALDRRDPDVLVLSAADLVPLLADAGVQLGRRPGYRQLAGESTYTSYGRVGHSPARYAVPGRAIVDRSNSFLLGRSSMAGLEYFVRRAGKPLQEVAKDSIGGVLTAMEIRAARERDVLAPWQKRQTERWKSLRTLHDADRGGFTFQPDVGVHEGVHELDFASLYPNVMREYDVSPETVCCDCHDSTDVPELGYSVCDREGFLGEVLAPLLDDRQGWKRALARDRAGGDIDSTDGEPLDEATRAALSAKAEAVKWVLVSCFGYQGYRHAKFGRIETHEAINAYARDAMLTAKEIAEAAGWRVVHGIVDSLWVTAAPDREQDPIREVAARVTDEVGIELEYEGRFDWIAFCPRKRASGAALMRYFGRWHDPAGDPGPDSDGRYKFRGIEARQRSTCPFVAAAQRDLVATFDRQRSPATVCDRLARHLAVLRRGAVPPADLAITQRVSKRADEYRRASRAKAALERAAAVGLERHPGQDVTYVAVDDDRSGAERVRLAFEVGEAGGSDPTGDTVLDAGDTDVEAGDDVRETGYDADFYADRLVRAAESLLAPLGWDEARIRQHLAERRDATLSSFGG